MKFQFNTYGVEFRLLLSLLKEHLSWNLKQNWLRIGWNCLLSVSPFSYLFRCLLWLPPLLVPSVMVTVLYHNRNHSRYVLCGCWPCSYCFKEQSRSVTGQLCWTQKHPLYQWWLVTDKTSTFSKGKSELLDPEVLIPGMASLSQTRDPSAMPCATLMGYRHGTRPVFPETDPGRSFCEITEDRNSISRAEQLEKLGW